MVLCLVLPNKQGKLRGRDPKASTKGPALCRLSRTTTQGKTLLSPAAACSLRCARYWRSSLADLLSTLKSEEKQKIKHSSQKIFQEKK